MSATADPVEELRTMTACTIHLVRHALVDPAAHAIHYGVMDVPICPATRADQTGTYAALARALPRPAEWLVTPLSRTVQTAQAIFAAGYGPATPTVEPGLLEQDIGNWHGLAHDALPPLLTLPPHPHWPMAPEEVPPGGESLLAVFARVGAALERIADGAKGADIVAVTHGGAIRAAVAHALRLAPDAALRLAIDNLSLTRLHRDAQGWRVLTVNMAAA